jgi:SAM-dependent methyltransferase
LSETPVTFERDYFTVNYSAGYDLSNPPYKFRSYLKEIRAFEAGGRLLDVGCAYGSFLKEAAAVFETHGSDISEHAVAIAQTRAPRAHVFRAALHEIPEGLTYDVVTSFDVLEHVPDLANGLQRLRRLLRPRGLLTIAVPVYDTPVGRLVRIMDHDPTHIHKVSRFDWLASLSAAGFSVVDWKGIWRLRLGSLGYVHYVSRPTRSFSPAVLIFARS